VRSSTTQAGYFKGRSDATQAASHKLGRAVALAGLQ